MEVTVVPVVPHRAVAQTYVTIVPNVHSHLALVLVLVLVVVLAEEFS